MTTKLTDQLQELLDTGYVSVDPDLLQQRSSDTWPLRMVQKAIGASREQPLCVVNPKSTEEVSKVLAFLNEKEVNTVPYGGGSGVNGAAEPNSESVVLDVGEMDDIIDLNEEDLTITVQPGVSLRDLEDHLDTYGYTSGHYPQSIELVQIGGLVATRSSGQFSTKYGNIEDLVLGLEAVLPSGEITRIKNVPRRSVGPDLRQLWIGSEGTLGVMTEITMKIFPKPANRWMHAYGVSSMREGLDIIRKFMREGWKPAVVRLRDATEASMSYSELVHDGESILLILSEGPKDYVRAEGKAVDNIIQVGGGRPLGSEPVEHWLKNRNKVDELEQYTSQGIIVETIEIAAGWKDIANIYEQVMEQLKREVPELLLATGHSSHSYQQGSNLYFILAAQPPVDSEEIDRVYRSIWSKVLETTLANNGTICHHHGIGKLRADWVPEELGSSYPLLKKVKDSLDPQGTMNMGTLLPQNSQTEKSI